MSESPAEVIQGRLGWESNDISKAQVSELSPHPKNKEIYGDTKDLKDTFVESVREKGVLEPLVVTEGKEIVSGHRRWQAAKKTDVEEVPVRYAEFDTELAEREALVEFNRQREKTPGQIVNEFEEILEIEQERAKERESETHLDGSDENGSPVGGGNVSTPDDVGKARDKAAEKVNSDVSGRTLEKGLDVKEKAEEGDETAQEEWDKLQNGKTTFHGAQETVKEAESEDDAEKEDGSGSDIEQFTSQETDEWSSPPEIVRPLDDVVDGFDLDPCSGAEESPFAENTYTEDDDGLSQSWFGDVWVNPPYSAMDDWTAKAVEESQSEETDRILYLCKGDSSTQWWKNGIQSASYVVAIEGRLSFGRGDNAAPFASHIFVFGDVSSQLLDALSEHGVVLEPVGGGNDE